jgi:hydrogenase nickel incorporation protein HypA/HybF
MHEYHAVESLIKQALEKAKANNASRITKVKLVIGEYSGFTESSVRMYFESLSEKTIAAGAELEIQHNKAESNFYIDNVEIEKAGDK